MKSERKKSVALSPYFPLVFLTTLAFGQYSKSHYNQDTTKLPPDFSGWAFPICGLEWVLALSRDFSGTHTPNTSAACRLI